MNFPHCKIIAFEGLDCSFKETNYKAFSERFKKFFTDEIGRASGRERV